MLIQGNVRQIRHSQSVLLFASDRLARRLSFFRRDNLACSKQTKLAIYTKPILRKIWGKDQAG